jgi:serine/threonine-protein kinase
MELVDGESLRSLLDRRGRLSWEATADIGEKVCEALEFAHQAGVVHQRLTPSRIMLAPNGEVKVLGFDCRLGDNDEVLGLHSPMAVAPYLAPEAFRGKQSAAQPTSDMFSRGVIMYECLTGELPWQASTPAEVVQARREREAPRVSANVLECPVWLDVLVAKLVETKRGIRLATADATRRAIFEAKRKVTEGMGAAKQAWSGRQGTLTVDTDRREIAELRKSQATRERDDSPFYERAWFLGLCLAGVIGLIAWRMWPKSEDALFAAAKPLMESESSVDWKEAKNRYLDELMSRFPNTKYGDEIAEFEDRVALNHAIEEVKNIDRFGRTPESDAQRLYAEGWKAERFDDPVTARQRYEAVLGKADQDDTDQRAYATLARQGIDRIKAAEAAQSKLALATQLAKDGKSAQARKLLNDILSLYGADKNLSGVVEQARGQLAELDGAR